VVKFDGNRRKNDDEDEDEDEDDSRSLTTVEDLKKEEEGGLFGVLELRIVREQLTAEGLLPRLCAEEPVVGVTTNTKLSVGVAWAVLEVHLVVAWRGLEGAEGVFRGAAAEGDMEAVLLMNMNHRLELV